MPQLLSFYSLENEKVMNVKTLEFFLRFFLKDFLIKFCFFLVFLWFFFFGFFLFNLCISSKSHGISFSGRTGYSRISSR